MIKVQPGLGRGDHGWAATELGLNMTTAKSRWIAAGSVATAWARARQTSRQLSRWIQVNIRDDRHVAVIKLGPGKLLWRSPTGKNVAQKRTIRAIIEPATPLGLQTTDQSRPQLA